MHTARTGIQPNHIARAVRLLQEGGIVAFPTDTVYGVGAHGLLSTAVERLCGVTNPSENQRILLFNLVSLFYWWRCYFA